MKQRFSGREEDYADGAAARVRGFSELAKSMKVRRSSSSTTTTYDPNSLLMSRGRLPEQSSSKITELSNQEDLNISRRTDQDPNSLLMSRGRLPEQSSSTITELSNQEDLNISRRTDQDPNSLLMSRGRLPEQSSPTITELSNQEDLNISRRTDQSTELPNQEQQPTSIRMFTCKTCGRKFGSFQALGGHRASHSMKLVGQGIVGEDGTYQNYFQYKAKLHRCSICGKGFPTGQSLGGHMRKHRELLDNQRLAASNIVHQQDIINKAANHEQSNNTALRWAQMNAAAIFQYSNHTRRYNAPHQAEAGVGIGTETEGGTREILRDKAPHQAEAGVGIGTETEGGTREILRDKVPNKRGLNFDLNLDASENEELGLTNDEW